MAELSETALVPDDREVRHLRRQAYDSLLQQALIAADHGNMQRYDELMARLVPHDASDGREARHADLARARLMDRFRLAMAALLVFGLIAIVAYAIGNRSDTAGEYVPLVSGLAGIAIGWLYGSSGGRRTSTNGEGE